MKTNQQNGLIFTHQLLKAIGLLQLFIALGMLALDVSVRGHSSWSIASIMIAGALVMIFCANAAVNDERIEQLKLKAAKFGLLLGVLVAALGKFYAVMCKASMALTAFDVLIVIMVITFGYYYFWRWRDSRPES